MLRGTSALPTPGRSGCRTRPELAGGQHRDPDGL